MKETEKPHNRLGTLFVCGTPIGNLDDASPRLIRTLNEVSLIACEDTRKTALLCQNFGIKTPLKRYDKFTEAKQTPKLIDILKTGQSIALVSDAGTPMISDPGVVLVKAAQNANIPTVPIPGPSAVSTLLSVSGLDASCYYFGGFLPKTNVSDYLSSLKELDCPLVFFESAQRLQKTLHCLTTLGFCDSVVCGKELTKRYEHVIYGAPDKVLSDLSNLTVKGEWTLVLRFMPPKSSVDHDKIVALQAAGFSVKDCLKIGKIFGWPSNEMKKTYLYKSIS